MALNENYKKLKEALKNGEIDLTEFEENTKLMKDALRTSLFELCNFLNFFFLQKINF